MNDHFFPLVKIARMATSLSIAAMQLLGFQGPATDPFGYIVFVEDNT